jgi:AraC-like DNA-binding protein
VWILKEILKTYGADPSRSEHGITCRINTPQGSYPLHRHDYFEFEMIIDGAIRHEMNGICEQLSKGDIYALSPNDLHRFSVIEPVRILSLGIYYKDAPQPIQKILASGTFPIRTTPERAEFEEICATFYGAAKAINEDKKFTKETVGAYTTLCLTAILNSPQKETSRIDRGGFSHVRRAMEFIDERLTSQVTLDEVAHHVHLTPSYFSKVFSEINGLGFHKYLIEQRVEYAKRLLINSESSITDIAFDSGFGSFSSFSRAFYSSTGITPKEFRCLSKKQ